MEQRRERLMSWRGVLKPGVFEVGWGGAHRAKASGRSF
jgi:hypothetical protein